MWSRLKQCAGPAFFLSVSRPREHASSAQLDGITTTGLSASTFNSGNSLLYVNLLVRPGASQTDPTALHLATQFQAEIGGSGRIGVGGKMNKESLFNGLVCIY